MDNIHEMNYPLEIKVELNSNPEAWSPIASFVWALRKSKKLKQLLEDRLAEKYYAEVEVEVRYHDRKEILYTSPTVRYETRPDDPDDIWLDDVRCDVRDMVRDLVIEANRD